MVQVQKKHARSMAVLCAIAVLLVVGSTVAYFSSSDEITNRFASSSFDIILTETNWNPLAARDVLPGDELPKNPQVINNDRTPGYIFLRVTVPADATAVDNDDGSSFGEAPEHVPLYKFMVWNGDSPASYSVDSSFSAAQRVRSSQWIALGSPSYRAADQSYVYVYAYSTNGSTLSPLREGETTEPLFDRLQLWNFNESIDLEQNHSVLVEAFGIQADLPGYSASQLEAIWTLASGGGGG